MSVGAIGTIVESSTDGGPGSSCLGCGAVSVGSTIRTFDAAVVSAYIKNHRDLTMQLQLSLGAGRCTFYTSDLTYEYVKLNAEYTT